MNISDKYKLIFFHLPKCAGKSVSISHECKRWDHESNECLQNMSNFPKRYFKKVHSQTTFTIRVGGWGVTNDYVLC